MLETCMKFRLGMMLVVCALMVACSASRQVPLNYQAGNPPKMSTIRVKTTVIDARPAVISGDREPWYIGRYAAGVGYTRNFSTEAKIPLAKLMHRDLLEEIRALGMGNVRRTERARQLDVKILNWDFDGTSDNVFRYSLKVTVTDEVGKVLTSGTVSQAVAVNGNFVSGAKGGFEQMIPGMYSRIISSLIRQNNSVRVALMGS
jgi:hypothetical protein